ncbi:MAG: nickel pincer cofactor biosynthesis protein LarC [Tissierellia bacterium]|nr:nickel pincer cofactor biosynthesis protein LarC [Tissierellia bacterium]
MELFFDCYAGISGNMFLGALLDLGLPFSYLENELKKLSLSGYELIYEKVKKSEITGTYFNVISKEGHHHRGINDIYKILDSSTLSEEVISLTKEFFQVIGQGEAKVHGTTIDKVHFHEVGAVDSIIDFVGAAIGLEYFQFPKVYFSPLSVGGGYVKGAHGTLPVPAPATAEILSMGQIPWKPGPVDFELVTPTGATIVYVLGQGNLDIITGTKVGYGAGSLDLEIPNLLRVVKLEKEEGQSLVEVNFDDMTGEELGALTEKLWAENPRDVFWTPIFMKKQRPGYQCSILCETKDLNTFKELLFTHSTTLGIRILPVEKVECARSFSKIPWKENMVTIKNGDYKGCKKTSVEFDDIKALSDRLGIPLYQIRRLIEGKAWDDFSTLGE